MLLLPVPTQLLKPGDDLTTIITTMIEVQQGDILVISSKAVATVEDAFIDLTSPTPSAEAKEWSTKTGRSAEFCEATLIEMKRLYGKIVGHCPGALLTEVRPEGLSQGTILTANAGLDESNAPKGKAIGWPRDPANSVASLRQQLETMINVNSLTRLLVNSKGNRGNELTKKRINNSPVLGVIISDSCIRPRRWGVTAFALTVSGLDPLAPQQGKKDLFGKELRITTEAVADQLATAANFLMGNAAQSTPAVIIRDHGLQLSEFEGWVPGIDKDEDLFKGLQ